MGDRSVTAAIIFVSLGMASVDLTGLWLTGERRYLVCGLATFYLLLCGQSALNGGWKYTVQHYSIIRKLFAVPADAQTLDVFFKRAMATKRQLTYALPISVLGTIIFIVIFRSNGLSYVVGAPVCFIVFLVVGNGLYFATIAPGITQALSCAKLQLDYMNPAGTVAVATLSRMREHSPPQSSANARRKPSTVSENSSMTWLPLTGTTCSGSNR